MIEVVVVKLTDVVVFILGARVHILEELDDNFFFTKVHVLFELNESKLSSCEVACRDPHSLTHIQMATLVSRRCVNRLVELVVDSEGVYIFIELGIERTCIIAHCF